MVGVPQLVLRPARQVMAGAETISGATRATVFSAVLMHGPISRAEVAQRTGLSPSTITKVVAPLVESDYLLELGSTSDGAPGRPRRMLTVNPNRHVVAGIKLRRPVITAVLTDLEARVVARSEIRWHGSRPEDTLDAAARAFDDLLSGHGSDRSRDVLGIGVATSGHVDTSTGTCLHSGVLGWHNVDVAGPLSSATGLPVVVSNNVNALGIAEYWFGKGRHCDSFAVVTVGEGIGCSLLIDGRPHLGATGLAGELGHLPVSAKGPRCTCGNVGCLEAVASSPAVLRQIAERGGPRLRSITRAARLARTDQGRDGRIARAAFRRAGEALGRGLASLCNLFNPERVILAGDGMSQHDLFGPALSDAFHAHAFSTAATETDLIVDAGDEDLWARGAACLVVHHAVSAELRG